MVTFHCLAFTTIVLEKIGVQHQLKWCCLGISLEKEMATHSSTLAWKIPRTEEHWSHLSVPTVLLGFLLPWTWGPSARLLQQSAAAVAYFWCGVAPLGRRRCPLVRGSSSRPLQLQRLCAVQSHHFMADRWGKQWLNLFFWAPKSLQMMTAAMKLIDSYSLEGKLWPT